MNRAQRLRRGLVMLMLTGSVACQAQRVDGLTLVEGGKAVAVLVIPDETRLVERYAALEFQHHVKLGSGAELPIVPESASADLPGGRVYFGRTRALVSAGLGGEDFGKYGYAGRLREGNLYFYGVDLAAPVPDDVPLEELLLQRARTLCWKKPIGTLLAVYDFLETELGARWIWPGPLGEFVPGRDTIAVAAYDRAGAPRYRSSHMLPVDEESLETRQWLLRHRFLRLEPDAYFSDHTFTKYWRDYKDTHPEIFGLRPWGSREPMPDQPGHLMEMCVSNPLLVKLKVERWKNGVDSDPGGASEGNFQAGYIAVHGNDVAGYCVCENCRAWDAPDERFATHDYWGKGQIKPFWDGGRWLRDHKAVVHQPAPSLTDRYMRFYLAVQAEAEKLVPGVVVHGQAYSNTSKPPKEVKLNDRIVINFVAVPVHGLWTPEMTRRSIEEWDGWRATGVRLFFRPNTTHRGHNLPNFYARQIGEILRHCAAGPMDGTQWDALFGQWAVQAPNFYVIGRLLQQPEKSVDEVLGEFYEAFGPARERVAAYFEHWDKVNNDQDPEALARYSTELAAQDFDIRHPLITADFYFTPAALARGRELLQQAAAAAEGDAQASARVRVLELGLRNAELTLETVAAFKRVHLKDPDGQARLVAAVKALRAFRAEHEGQYVNLGQWAIDLDERGLWGEVKLQFDE